MFSSTSAIAGFVAGIAGTILLSLTVTVLFNGKGLSDRVAPDARAVVYPNL